ncbi:MAG: MBL fold metallo-hydrolase [Hyphomicrobiaceae bacterium]
MPQLWWVLTSVSWVEVPITVYVLEHHDGLVLFDAGMDPAIGTDPKYVSSALGRFFLRRLFRFHIGPNDGLTKKLDALGYNASDVRKVVVSHLHFDHIGCISEVPQAELLVSREEWRLLSCPHPEREFILREHIELPHAKWRQIDFAPADEQLFAPFGCYFDVMGDRSMMLLPTPGHTAGSMSMLARSKGFPPLLFVSDLTYDVDMLMNDQVPGNGDPTQLRCSFAKVRALKEQLPDLVVLPAHDNSAIETLRAVVPSKPTS